MQIVFTKVWINPIHICILLIIRVSFLSTFDQSFHAGLLSIFVILEPQIRVFIQCGKPFCTLEFTLNITVRYMNKLNVIFFKRY